MTTPTKPEVLDTLVKAKDALDSSVGILNKLYERFPEVTVYHHGAFRMHKCADNRSDECETVYQALSAVHGAIGKVADLIHVQISGEHLFEED
jgi:hypothetical protein